MKFFGGLPSWETNLNVAIDRNQDKNPRLRCSESVYVVPKSEAKEHFGRVKVVAESGENE